MCRETLPDLKVPSFVRAMVFTAIEVAVSGVTYRCDLDAILSLLLVELYNVEDKMTE